MSEFDLSRLGYPRAFFFWTSTGFAHRYPFEEWEKIFLRLHGVMGKVLNEDFNNYTRFIPYYVRFKKRHPEKLVLNHYNGNARDTRDGIEKFFAGHWIYFNGCHITRDVSAEEGESEISVEDPKLFRVNIGRYLDRNEDIGLCLLDPDGKPDWHHSEQVQLISIDHARKVLRIRRGCYGTKPIALPANKSYAAAHVTEGPWGEGEDQSTLMWFYNFSTACPRDARGRSCVDVYVDDLASHFIPGGDLESFDGLEFDVLYHERTSREKDRGYDMDADGHVDNGWIDGVNTYGIGVYDFCRRLRRKLGEEKIIQADGQSATNQRCFGILNGIESEGWPYLRDLDVEDWSGGINRHFFWNQNARRPVFNYINHKFVRIHQGITATAKATDYRPQVPFNIHRLVFAAGQFFDAVICYAYAPDPEPNEAYGIWDELYMGVEHKTGWLGSPLGSAVRLALQTKDLLKGAGEEMKPALVRRFRGENVKFTIEDRSLMVSATKESPLRFRLKDVPCDGPDLFVSLKIRAAEMKGYPIDIPRLVWVGITKQEAEPVRFMTFSNPNWFEASFYYRKVSSNKVDLEFEAESREPLWIKDLTAHAYPDAIIREFENGLVLANPSLHEYTFDLDALTPRKRYRRLIGSSKQDPKTNDGSSVEGKVTLGPRDGLFLTRTN